MAPGQQFNLNVLSYKNRNSHFNDKMIIGSGDVQLSYMHQVLPV